MRGRDSILCSILLATVVSLAPGGYAIAGETKTLVVEEPHELGLFLGGAHRNGEDGFSIGLDYQYRISSLFGFGGLIEYTAGDIREGVLGFPFYFRVWRGLTLVGAPGIELSTTGSDEFLLRLGADYGFEIGRGFEVVPGLYVDLTSSETTLVYGVALAKSF
jgi:hypothetical protein